MPPLTQKPEWAELKSHKKTLPQLKNLNNELMVSNQGLHLDYSKNIITPETIEKLTALAKACDLETWRDKMFSGEKINNTEDRAVLHTLLRAPKTDDEKSIFVHDVLERMKITSDRVRNDSEITDIVNIGIGGSDLGPYMVCESIKHIASGPTVHFVSNVDGAHISETLKGLDPRTTLFLIASKTFTTQETMTNALSARGYKESFHGTLNKS